MDRMQEIEAKIERAREFMSANELDAVALGTQANFAWITGGADNHVGLSSEAGVATVVITQTGRHVVASAIEAPRMADEEIADLGFEVHDHPWHTGGPEEIVSRLAGSEAIAADGHLPGARNFAGEIARLRWQLLPPEVARYEEVGAECARILEKTAREIIPGVLEHRIAGVMQAECVTAGLLPNVCLVAADERAYKYRHPIPTDTPLRRLCMLVMGARRGGLAVSATRIVHFGPVPDELARKHEAVCAVDACFILGSRPGAQVKELFRAAGEEYARQGFPDEWRLHHQGGATGYAARDYKAHPQIDEMVLEGQAFAWNPSIAGTKSEDTILATEEGPEILSEGLSWPMLSVAYEGQAIERPAILER